jgi:protein phosphatase 1 regulatory subunit 7
MEFLKKDVDGELTPAEGTELMPEGAVMCGDCVVCPPAADAESDAEKDKDVAPIDRIIIPSDVVDIKEDDEAIYVVGTRGEKVTKIRGLEKMSKLKDLTLRSCLISSMEGVESLTTLRKLELYDNHIDYITHIHRLQGLTILDISFNAIRDMGAVSLLPNLEELYIAQNKLREIKGLENMEHLRILDLGANRIRKMEGLQNLRSLESLWLGKNKIEEIAGIEGLTKLRQLDVQNNRLTGLGNGLHGLVSLKELYLACNLIPDFEGLPVEAPISTVDLSSNKVKSVAGIEQHPSLEEVWMTGSALERFEDLDPLKALPNLTCLYLEHSPIAKAHSAAEYKRRVLEICPKLTQLDADFLE